MNHAFAADGSSIWIDISRNTIESLENMKFSAQGSSFGGGTITLEVSAETDKSNVRAASTLSANGSNTLNLRGEKWARLTMASSTTPSVTASLSI